MPGLAWFSTAYECRQSRQYRPKPNSRRGSDADALTTVHPSDHGEIARRFGPHSPQCQVSAPFDRTNAVDGFAEYQYLLLRNRGPSNDTPRHASPRIRTGRRGGSVRGLRDSQTCQEALAWNYTVHRHRVVNILHLHSSQRGGKYPCGFPLMHFAACRHAGRFCPRSMHVGSRVSSANVPPQHPLSLPTALRHAFREFQK